MNWEVTVMARLEVFDPPMCCSTGVCGPSVDPALAGVAADLAWLSDQGVHVERHNLSQEPGAFAEREVVRSLLAEHGDGALPAVTVDGALRSWGRYPSRDELAAWALGGPSSGALDPATTELVAIGAALGANCESCLRYHYGQARRLGVRSEAVAEAVRVAQAVKDTPARAMLELAAKLLGPDVGAGDTDEETGAGEEGSVATGCCGAAPAADVPLVNAGAASSGSSECCG